MVFTDFPNKKKTLRTVLYNDQQFSLWEMEILHTPIVQRLYDLKQLGFSDRVFPDAVHSRFNHILGVAEVARQMVDNLFIWLKNNKKAKFSCLIDGKVKKVSGPYLAKRVGERKDAVRLIALLHDLTHAAFGHTLEDEVRVFEEKHDDPKRQAIFFDALTVQLVAAWLGEFVEEEFCDIADLLAFSRLESDEEEAKTKAINFAEAIKKHNPDQAKILAGFLRELEFASRALLHLEWAHGSNELEAATSPKLIVTQVRRVLDPESKPLKFTPHLDLFLLDLIGNTICADLLDYAKRDATNAGLKHGFDIRLIKYVCAVSVNGDLSPDKNPCVRLATQFFTDKMRYDVLSEMSQILNARYLINERILFHPAKCASGAVLGTAVQFLGLTNPPVWVQALGDQVFLSLLDQMAHYLTEAAKLISVKNTLDFEKIAKEVLPVDSMHRKLLMDLLIKNSSPSGKPVKSGKEFKNKIQPRVEAAQKLLWRLKGRRNPYLVYRLRLGAQKEDGTTTKKIAQDFSNLQKRFSTERVVEGKCNLPNGSIVIHCPTENPGVKIVRALVVGPDLTKARHLRDVARGINDRFHHELLPYQEVIRATEDMYTSIWQLHVYLDPDYAYKEGIVKLALRNELGVQNDSLMQSTKQSSENNRFDFVAGKYAGLYGIDVLPDIIQEIDSRLNRFRDEKLKQEEIALKAINVVNTRSAQHNFDKR